MSTFITKDRNLGRTQKSMHNAIRRHFELMDLLYDYAVRKPGEEFYDEAKTKNAQEFFRTLTKELQGLLKKEIDTNAITHGNLEFIILVSHSGEKNKEKYLGINAENLTEKDYSLIKGGIGQGLRTYPKL